MLRAFTSRTESDVVPEAVEELLAPLVEAGATPRGALLFAAVDHDHQALVDALMDRFPDMALIGCTTDGEMCGCDGFAEDSATLIAFDADEVVFGAGLAEGLSTDIAGAIGRAVAEATASLGGGAPSLCFTTPESLTASAVQVLQGLQAALGPAFPIFGGTAADAWEFQGTKQFCGRRVVSYGVPVLLMGGSLRYASGIRSGWKALGIRAVATEVEGNVLHRIDDDTATAYYQQHLGPGSEPTGEYPLAVYPPGGDRFYLRAPLTFDFEAGTITLAGDVPQGATIQLTRATRDEILGATRDAVDEARRAWAEKYGEARPEAVVAVSCAARKQLLGTRAPLEIDLLSEGLDGVPIAGFYAYGEIGPFDGASHFHNETMVTLLLGEG